MTTNTTLLVAILAAAIAFALWHGYTTPETSFDSNGNSLSLREGVR